MARKIKSPEIHETEHQSLVRQCYIQLEGPIDTRPGAIPMHESHTGQQLLAMTVSELREHLYDIHACNGTLHEIGK